MKKKGTVIVMYDAPAAIDPWMHGPHYDEVKRTPGVRSVSRYEVMQGPAGARKYIAVIETDDLEATVAWRDGVDGQRSQSEANDRGVTNRFGLVCKRIY
jgi:hypothetical protein